MSLISNEGLQETLLGLVKSKRGATLREIRNHPPLLDLVCVRLHATGADVMQLEESFYRILDQICRTLEPEDMVHAARSLFGLAPMSKLRLPTERRRLAGKALGYEGKNAWDPFRKRREGPLIAQVADLLYLREVEAVDRDRRTQSGGHGQSLHSPLGGLEQVLELERRGTFDGYVRVGVGNTYRIAEADLQLHAISRVYEIEAVRSGVSFFRHSYRWTGNGMQDVPVITSPGHRSLGILAPSGQWVFHYVVFDEPLRAGDRAIVKVEQSLYDTERRFQSFLSANVRNIGFDWMKLKVVLPASRFPVAVHRTVFNGLGLDASVVPELSGEGNVELDGEPGMASMQWKPEQLLPEHRYQLLWRQEGGGLYPPD